MRRVGLIAPMRPDKYVRIAAAMRRENMAATSGFASAAQRCPDRTGLVDELGTLTWKQLDERADALGAALQNVTKGQLTPAAAAPKSNVAAAAAPKSNVAAAAAPKTIGIM